MASFWRKWRGKAPTSEGGYEKEIKQLRAKAPIPSIWLFGKTGSGKSSVVRYLTGAEAATIGEGFRPETKTSQRFDFPNSLEPLLTFLDTRGLGEVAYDPQEDIARIAGATQLMIVTVRVTDHALQNIIEPLRSIRKSAPHRPVLLVLTCLHQATGSVDLSAGVDPFKSEQDKASRVIPEKIQTLIEEKVKQFSGLHDVVVPIDLTKPADGFADPDFGGLRLKQAILDYLPHAYRQALLTLNDSDRPAESYRQKKSRWQVLASSALAASVGAVPFPWVDIPAVLGIQTHLAWRLAKIYDQEITATDWTLLSSAAGSHIALRMGVREVLKFVPFVGMAVSAASSFAFTYALGMTWDWYFADKRGGNVPSAEKLKEVFAEQLQRGHQLWRAE
jgi:uncharacterized protein (DUF697 family)